MELGTASPSVDGPCEAGALPLAGVAAAGLGAETPAWTACAELEGRAVRLSAHCALLLDDGAGYPLAAAAPRPLAPLARVPDRRSKPGGAFDLGCSCRGGSCEEDQPWDQPCCCHAGAWEEAQLAISSSSFIHSLTPSPRPFLALNAVTAARACSTQARDTAVECSCLFRLTCRTRPYTENVLVNVSSVIHDCVGWM